MRRDSTIMRIYFDACFIHLSKGRRSMIIPYQNPFHVQALLLPTKTRKKAFSKGEQTSILTTNREAFAAKGMKR